nr:immunoglobulin light chain junction region [Macaca mulatta]MOV92202.1 immunoglobulin light chain junction region [Macaca mulatta]MOV92409.1 immunoglobulin light chain junction region [Macaca mulatta]MOX10016.1 immunoglobulin light chain junction region [Macaca mulatta]MOX47792.1 immunoglobulin light chain junction region [Macaca mulatta]
CLQDTQLPLTF